MIQTDIKDILQNINFDKLNNKRILITGASGLLGVYLVSCIKELLGEYNIESYFWIKNDLDDDIKPFFAFDNVIVQDDITNDSIFDTLPDFDFIIHSSGYGQPTKFLENKLKTIEINTKATMQLFKKLKKDGTFLFLSSSEIYNGLDKYLINETEIGVSNTNNPRACYIESKRCGETICHAYVEMGYNVKIVRLSLAYGPGTKKHDKRVLNSLIEKAIFNDKIELLDSGSAIRTYCYITDVIEMIWNILLHSKDIVYNVGGDSELSIFELAELVGNYFRKPVIVPVNDLELKGSPKIVNIDIGKYTKEFDKKTFVSIKTGLKNTIEWQKNLYS